MSKIKIEYNLHELKQVMVRKSTSTEFTSSSEWTNELLMPITVRMCMIVVWSAKKIPVNQRDRRDRSKFATAIMP